MNAGKKNSVPQGSIFRLADKPKARCELNDLLQNATEIYCRIKIVVMLRLPSSPPHPPSLVPWRLDVGTYMVYVGSRDKTAITPNISNQQSLACGSKLCDARIGHPTIFWGFPGMNG